MNKKTFFSNELTVFSVLGKVHLDFKCIFPTKEQDEVTTTNIEHNVIVVDPNQAKAIARMLKQIINDYEKKWGKLKSTQISFKTKNKKEEKPSYVG